MSSQKNSELVSKHYKLNEKMQVIGSDNFWNEIGNMAHQFKAVNLGQGFPDYQSATYLREIIRNTLEESDDLIYQYTRSPGHLRLVKAIGKTYSKFMGREINPLEEILITVGADGSLFNAFTAFLEKDDEAIIIEPFFDCYAPLAMMAGGKCVYVPLRLDKSNIKNRLVSSADWKLDYAELEAAFTPKTKLIIINNPNNPLGKVYSQDELEAIARLCIEHNIICVSDEVYEHLAMERPHIRIATLPGMWERTVTIGSAGKSFSTTGAKIGWTIGPKDLVSLCVSSHNNSIYVCPTFMQEVIARCFELELSRIDKAECYFSSIKAEIMPKRDNLIKSLIEAGFDPIIPEGGYFIMTDISKVCGDLMSDLTEMKDAKYVKFLIKEKGLATIPSSAFYSSGHKKIGENYIRLCFFKSETTLDRSANIIKSLSVL